MATRPDPRSAWGRWWPSFRRWRQTRPFPGGLLTALGGLWIFGTTQLSLDGLTFHLGPTGFLSWLIPTILVVCGLLMWFTPNQRMFYAVVAAVTAVYSLTGVNLGGFLIGTVLALVGASLGFAWMPPRNPAATQPDVEAPADVVPESDARLVPGFGADSILGPTTGTAAVTDHIEAGPAVTDHTEVDHTGSDPAKDADRRRRIRRLFLIMLIAGGLSALATAIGPAANPVNASCPIAAATPPPGSHSPKATGQPSRTGEPAGTTKPTRTTVPGPPTPRPAATSPTPVTAHPTPSASPANRAELAYREQLAPPADRTTMPRVGTTTTPEPTTAKKTRHPARVRRQAVDSMNDLRGCTAEDLNRPGPVVRVAAPQGQPRVARPSRLTGSRVTMIGLSYDGVVDLPTAGGTIRTLKFSMDESITDDFELVVSGPGNERISLQSGTLTVRGDVKFYASRFRGSLIGIPLAFTPELPPPLTLPIMVFGDPDIQLVYVDCDTLVADNLHTTIQ